MSVQTDFPIGSRITHQYPTRGRTQVIVTGKVVAHGSYENIFVIPDTISDIYGTPSAGPDRNAYNMSARYCTLETTENPEEYKKTKLLNKIHDLDKRWKLQQEAKKLSALATAPVRNVEAETTSQHIAMDTNGALAVGFTGTGSGTWQTSITNHNRSWMTESTISQEMPQQSSHQSLGSGSRSTESPTENFYDSLYYIQSLLESYTSRNETPDTLGGA